jgi:Protein of unknown function (DUF3467)
LDVPDTRFANYFEISFTETHFVFEFCQAYGDEPKVVQARIATVPQDATNFLNVLAEVIRNYQERFPTGPRG